MVGMGRLCRHAWGSQPRISGRACMHGAAKPASVATGGMATVCCVRVFAQCHAALSQPEATVQQALSLANSVSAHCSSSPPAPQDGPLAAGPLLPRHGLLRCCIQRGAASSDSHRRAMCGYHSSPAAQPALRMVHEVPQVGTSTRHAHSLPPLLPLSNTCPTNTQRMPRRPAPLSGPTCLHGNL